METKIARSIVFTLFSLLSLAAGANEPVRFGEFSDQEFSPARGEKINIPVIIDRDAEIQIQFFTVDGEMIQTIRSNGVLKKGAHDIVWDGKDEQGTVVPDEAYVPVIRAKSENGEILIDPRKSSGGEVIKDIQLVRNDHQSFRYQLPVAARVSIRAGIKAGPLLKVLADWEPHAAGQNILYWDGYDQDKLINLVATGRQKLVAAAYKLPDNSIITSGNKTISYFDYYKKKGWQLKPVNLANVALQRGDQAISRHYYIPYLMNKSPKVNIKLLGELEKSTANNPVIPLQVSIKVNMDADSKWSLQESRYEVGFFVDNQFLSEEEQGYVPLTWRWKPNNLKPGEHILTVNVSGFRGQVGVKSLKFEIPEP